MNLGEYLRKTFSGFRFSGRSKLDEVQQTYEDVALDLNKSKQQLKGVEARLVAESELRRTQTGSLKRAISERDHELDSLRNKVTHLNDKIDSYEKVVGDLKRLNYWLKKTVVLLREGYAEEFVEHHMITHSRDMVIATNSRDLVTHISPRAAHLMGRASKEVLGKRIYDFFGENVVHVRSKMYRSIGRHSTGPVLLERYTFVRGDGELSKPMNIVVVPIYRGGVRKSDPMVYMGALVRSESKEEARERRRLRKTEERALGVRVKETLAYASNYIRPRTRE